jgi:hypothetical protein
MRDNCVISSEKGFRHIIARTEFPFNEIDMFFLLDQHAELDLYSAST